jgi:hypothetical protein
VATKKRSPTIGRSALRRALRDLDPPSQTEMLDAAIDLLSDAQLARLVASCIDLATLAPPAPVSGLLDDVKRFEAEALAGGYYEPVSVNSRNFMHVSRGTTAFISDCLRLLGRCVTEARDAPTAATAEAFERIFALLAVLDDDPDGAIVFFADEPGAWQVGVDWLAAVSAWLSVLAATATPTDYAERAQGVIERHGEPRRRSKLVAAARTAASDAQRGALDALRRAR